MIEYMIVCTAFGVLMLMVSWRATALSNRFRLWCCVTAMACWLVPWSMFYQASPEWAAVVYVDQSVNPIASLPVAEHVVASRLPSVPHPFWWAVVIGMVVFVLRLIRYTLYVRSLAQTAADQPNEDSVELGVRIRRSSLVTSPQLVGFFSPVVWLRDHDDKSSSDLAIRHELVHKDRHDNWILLLTTLLRDVIWWNPVMHLLHRRCRELIELSCDELCQQRDERYRESLAVAVLEGAHTHHSLIASAFGSRKFMIERIKALEEVGVNRERLGHVVGLVLLSIAVFLSPALIHAQTDVVELRLVTVEDGDEDRAVIDLQFKGMDVYHRLLERADENGVLAEKSIGETGHRQLRIQTSSKAMSNDILTAFNGTPMEGWYSYRDEPPPDFLADQPLLISVSVDVDPDGRIFDGQLAASNGDWTGINTSKYLVRVRPMLQYIDEIDDMVVHFDVEISERTEAGYRVIGRPRTINKFSHRSSLRSTNEEGRLIYDVRLTAEHVPS